MLAAFEAGGNRPQSQGLRASVSREAHRLGIKTCGVPLGFKRCKRFLWFLSKSFYSFNRKVKISARQIAKATRPARFLGAMIIAPRLLVQNLLLPVHDVNAFAGISHAAAGNVIDSRLFRLPKRRACYTRGNLHFLFRQSKQVLATRICGVRAAAPVVDVPVQGGIVRLVELCRSRSYDIITQRCGRS